VSRGGQTLGWRTQSLQDCPQKLIKMWVMTRRSCRVTVKEPERLQ
jgi:hypothetical protein